jgi:hypothetical protein
MCYLVYLVVVIAILKFWEKLNSIEDAIKEVYKEGGYQPVGPVENEPISPKNE